MKITHGSGHASILLYLAVQLTTTNLDPCAMVSIASPESELQDMYVYLYGIMGNGYGLIKNNLCT